MTSPRYPGYRSRKLARSMPHRSRQTGTGSRLVSFFLSMMMMEDGFKYLHFFILLLLICTGYLAPGGIINGAVKRGELC